ncbi:hypothetical protein EK21DRAFT_85607 [Setomelanomma holmii]|uniref:Uncharacterized protein n=1 Tax=Setomelanomma holmii TaxID=210430 RepID=A0A9P4HH43_9PLEO|nr:hypothetical protein EK21DRAFT_85607 [Setomelanomma holmii]
MSSSPTRGHKISEEPADYVLYESLIPERLVAASPGQAFDEQTGMTSFNEGKWVWPGQSDEDEAPNVSDGLPPYQDIFGISNSGNPDKGGAFGTSHAQAEGPEAFKADEEHLGPLIAAGSQSQQLGGTAQESQTQHAAHEQNQQHTLQEPLPAGNRPTKTIKFRSILALTGYEAGKLQPASPPIAPPATAPESREPGNLLRNTLAASQRPSDLDMAIHLINTGVVADPYPHYLWNESDKMSHWFVQVLTSKLNYLLELDSSKRYPKQKLLKGVSPIPQCMEAVVLWARTGRRKNIRFRAYDDCIARLQRVDLKRDMTIFDYMVLITELHRDMLPPNGATEHPGPSHAVALHPHLAPWLPRSLNHQELSAESYAQVSNPMDSTQSVSQQTTRQFEVHRDENVFTVSSEDAAQRQGMRNDKTNIPSDHVELLHKRKTSASTIEVEQPKKMARTDASGWLIEENLGPFGNDRSSNVPRVDWSDSFWELPDMEQIEAADTPFFSSDPPLLSSSLPSWSNDQTTFSSDPALLSSNPTVPSSNQSAPTEQPNYGPNIIQFLADEMEDDEDEHHAVPAPSIEPEQDEGDEVVWVDDGEGQETQRLLDYSRTNRSIPESEFTAEQTATAVAAISSSSHPRALITNTWLDAEVVVRNYPPPLLRLMSFLVDGDDSLLARCIRFAQSEE